MTATAPISTASIELACEVRKYYDDPLGFVADCFPWGEKGLGSFEQEVDKWQIDFLKHIGEQVKKRQFDGFTPVDPIREAIASGHGIGKSTMIALLTLWIMSTRPGSRGTITANTYKQLETKTWAAIQRWGKLCITSSWFNVTKEKMEAIVSPEDWFCSPQSCAEENSEAFAGQHADKATSFYMFDEDSLVPDMIHEVAERGGLTDGEPMMFVFGNMTRNVGEFYEICYGKKRTRWNSRAIDSRDCRRPNKQLIQEMIEDFGVDSDVVRTRVRGLAPRASETQFIGKDVVEDACKRTILPLDDDPLVVGFDVTGGGEAWNVFRFRRGLDAVTIPPIRIPGDSNPQHREILIAQAARILSDTDPKRRVAMMFVDSAFGGPIVERLHVLGYQNVVEVNFGQSSLDKKHYGNLRAQMWDGMKTWLIRGAIDKNDKKLQVDLVGPGFHHRTNGQLILESKADMQERGLASPDDADALALTFAAPVAPVLQMHRPPPPHSGEPRGWMG